MYNTFLFLHIVSVLLLVGITFYAFAGPSASTRKSVMMYSGIASLVVVVTGFGMMHQWGWPGWFFIKLVSWLGISAVAGMAYRRKKLIKPLMLITIVLAVAAVWAVVYKPF